MTEAIQVHAPGGPEVLRLGPFDPGRPGPGEALVRQTAIGVNFKDVYERQGLYPMPVPFVPGNEGAGVVEAVGEGVLAPRPGDRVAYANESGAYATMRRIRAERLVVLPAAINDRTAAAVMLKGMTAEYLLHRTYKVGPGTTLLFHAAAGGVGLIACQWAAALGAMVIGTAGSPEKMALAKAHGCAHVIDYRREDVPARVREITGGRGVDVVYDSVGKDTFPASLDCLRPRGMWVSFGQSSGPVPGVEPLLLSRKGSLFMTRPTLLNYIADPAELQASAAALFAMLGSRTVKVTVGRTFPLAGAGDAHRALEGRETVGSTLLLP